MLSPLNPAEREELIRLTALMANGASVVVANERAATQLISVLPPDGAQWRPKLETNSEGHRNQA